MITVIVLQPLGSRSLDHGADYRGAIIGTLDQHQRLCVEASILQVLNNDRAEEEQLPPAKSLEELDWELEFIELELDSYHGWMLMMESPAGPPT